MASVEIWWSLELPGRAYSPIPFARPETWRIMEHRSTRSLGSELNSPSSSCFSKTCMAYFSALANAAAPYSKQTDTRNKQDTAGACFNKVLRESNKIEDKNSRCTLSASSRKGMHKLHSAACSSSWLKDDQCGCVHAVYHILFHRLIYIYIYIYIYIILYISCYY